MHVGRVVGGQEIVRANWKHEICRITVSDVEDRPPLFELRQAGRFRRATVDAWSRGGGTGNRGGNVKEKTFHPERLLEVLTELLGVTTACGMNSLVVRLPKYACFVSRNRHVIT